MPQTWGGRGAETLLQIIPQTTQPPAALIQPNIKRAILPVQLPLSVKNQFVIF